MKSVVKLQFHLKLTYYIQILREICLIEAENEDLGKIKCFLTQYT